MAVATLPPQEQEHPQELVIYRAAHLRQDIALLKKGSSHLRTFAWLLCIPAVFMGFFAFLLMLMNPILDSILIFIATVLVLIIAFFFFSVSTYIRRARRWAVYTALVLASFTGILTSIDLIRPFHQRTPGSIMISSLYLIMHLNTFKDLLFCLGAIDRITWAASLRFKKPQPEPAKEPWEK